MDIDKLNSIQALYPYRDVQTEQLLHYINLPDTSNILVYGPRATCKTSIIREITFKFKLFHVWVNLLQFLNNRSIYEFILNQLKNQITNFSDEQDINVTCVNSIVFVEKLEIILNLFFENKTSHRHVEFYKTKLIIVLDNADALFKDDNDEFIYLMNNIEQLTGKICPISVIYISSHSHEWMMRNSEFKPTCLQIHFNNYTNEQLLQLISASGDPNYSIEFYTNYVNIIIKSLTPFTRNLVELQNICVRNFHFYVKPIEDDEMTTKDTSRLYLKFQAKLHEIIENLSDHKIHRLKTSIQMSKSLSYLLIASYLASYNSVKSDKNHFVRNQGRNKNKRKSKKVVDIESKAPKPFSFERLFSIYQALLNLNETDSNFRSYLMVPLLAFQEFNELLKQNLVFLIKSANTWPISSAAKYQVSDIVTNKHIDDISFSIGFNLKAFTEN